MQSAGNAAIEYLAILAVIYGGGLDRLRSLPFFLGTKNVMTDGRYQLI